MPYSISTEHEECSTFAVVKDDDNSLMGCHKTKEKAEAQLTALNIAYEEEQNSKKKKKKKYNSITEVKNDNSEVLKLNNMSDNTELRSWNIEGVEQREDENGQLHFSGYASVFEYPYAVNDLRGSYNEIVTRGAFTKTLQERDDVKLLVNHEGIPMARTKSGTLELREDEKGLRVDATLDPTNPTVAEVASAMSRSDLTEMSFAFQAIKDDFNEAGDERTIREAKLYDVSIVTSPASPATSASLSMIRGVDIPALEKALVEARNDDPVDSEVLLTIIDQLHDLLPKSKGASLDLAKRKLQMIDIHSS